MGLKNEAFTKEFYHLLETSAETLPQKEKENLYRQCAIRCMDGYVLEEQKRWFEECNGDMDLVYTKYENNDYLFGEIIEPGHIYEMGYKTCLCPLVDDGFLCPAGHCECSRQSILYVLHTLLPEKKIEVQMLHTVLSGANECRFRITVE